MPESNNLTERKRIKLIKCTPENPVFLVWLNQLGGWSYWCFSGRSKVKKTSKTLDTFMTYEKDLETSKGGIHGRGANVENSIRVKASHLTKNEYEGVSEIVSSPIVYRVYEDGKKLEVIPSDFSYTFDADTTIYGVELVVNLPETQTQKIK